MHSVTVGKQLAGICKAHLRKLIRSMVRTRLDNDVWPAALVLFAVIAPAACLLWFMSAAMRNERFAVQQKLAEAYRVQLSVSQSRLQKHWTETAAELEELAAKNSAPRRSPNPCAPGL